MTIILVTVLALSCIACTAKKEVDQTEKEKNPTSTTQSEGKVPEPDKYGGRITIAMDQDIVTLDNFIARANSDTLCSLACLETLFRFDENGSPEPYLIESYEESKKDLTITLVVRKGIKFQDGSDLNADVVAWHLNTYKEKGTYGQSFLGLMNHAEATDDYTVVMHMDTWDSVILYTLCRNAGRISSKLAYETPGADSLTEHVVGTGPFMVSSREPGVSISLIVLMGIGREPYLDAIDFVVYKEASVAQGCNESR